MANDSRPTAAQAWQMMLEGNGRWQRDEREDPRRSAEERAAAVAGQTPAAMILSCSDSRVPAELVFDLGLGTCSSSGPRVRSSTTPCSARWRSAPGRWASRCWWCSATPSAVR